MTSVCPVKGSWASWVCAGWCRCVGSDVRPEEATQQPNIQLQLDAGTGSKSSLCNKGKLIRPKRTTGGSRGRMNKFSKLMGSLFLCLQKSFATSKLGLNNLEKDVALFLFQTLSTLRCFINTTFTLLYITSQQYILIAFFFCYVPHS